MITETIKKLNKELCDAEKEGITILESHLDADSNLKIVMQKSLKRRLNFCMTLLKQKEEDIL